MTGPWWLYTLIAVLIVYIVTNLNKWTSGERKWYDFDADEKYGEEDEE